jgi:hypothetical protein
VHPDLKNLPLDIIHAIPTQGFPDPDLNSANRYLNVMLQQVEYFVWSVRDQIWTASDNSVDTNYGATANHFYPSKTQQERANSFKQGLRRSWVAFQTVSKPFTIKEDDTLVDTALSLGHTCSTIALDCCFGPELSYDTHIPEFQAALTQAETLIAATPVRTGPKCIISAVLVKALYFIAVKCRLVPVRTKAIAHLRAITIPRREGIWDSGAASTVAALVMEVEYGCGKTVVPESRRVRAIRTSFDLHKHRGKMRYLIPETDSGNLVSHQVEFEW